MGEVHYKKIKLPWFFTIVGIGACGQFDGHGDGID